MLLTEKEFQDYCIHIINELHKEALRYQGDNNKISIRIISREHYDNLDAILTMNNCICYDWGKFFKVID